MTLFESIFALISVVTSLALTHLIAGVVRLIRHAERGRVSLIHACWTWLAFVLVIGNWASLIGVQGNPQWPPDRIILWLTAMISLYVFTALVLPATQTGEPVDLVAFEQTESRRTSSPTMCSRHARCCLSSEFGASIWRQCGSPRFH